MSGARRRSGSRSSAPGCPAWWPPPSCNRAGHDVHVFEAGVLRRAATPTPSTSRRRGGQLGRGHRLHRLQRAQLPQLRAHARRARCCLPAGGDELLGLRRPGRVRVGDPGAARALRPARARPRSALSPDAARPRALQPRGSHSWSAAATRGRRCAASSPTGGYSEYFVERLLVPQASAVWSADPDQMWSFPAGFLAEFFDNHRVLQLRGRPSLALDRRWLAPLRGGADRALSRPRSPARSGAPVLAPCPTGVTVELDGTSERFDEVVLAVHSDGRWRCSPTPAPPRRRSWARSPTSATRRCCTPTRG